MTTQLHFWDTGDESAGIGRNQTFIELDLDGDTPEESAESVAYAKVVLAEALGKIWDNGKVYAMTGEEIDGGAEGIATCIACGCDDDHACVEAEQPCSWLVVDYAAGVGVCSACPEAIERWDRGDRAVAPFGDYPRSEAVADHGLQRSRRLKTMTKAQLLAAIADVADSEPVYVEVYAPNCRTELAAASEEDFVKFGLDGAVCTEADGVGLIAVASFELPNAASNARAVVRQQQKNQDEEESRVASPGKGR